MKKGISDPCTGPETQKVTGDNTNFNYIKASVGSDAANTPMEYGDLERWQKLIVTTWIKENLVSRVTINKYHTSYELKHIFERSPDGFYLTNGAFKGALLAAGFEKHSTGINWCFAITERSIREASKAEVSK